MTNNMWNNYFSEVNWVPISMGITIGVSVVNPAISSITFITNIEKAKRINRMRGACVA